MTSILQLGGTTQEGQQPQVDILGARQSIDMLQVLEDKTKGNLSPKKPASSKAHCSSCAWRFSKSHRHSHGPRPPRPRLAQGVQAPQAPASSANDGGDPHVPRHRYLDGGADPRLRLHRLYLRRLSTRRPAQSPHPPLHPPRLQQPHRPRRHRPGLPRAGNPRKHPPRRRRTLHPRPR
ncbi:DUF1844 domain-containing protein [Tunturiibacter gelidiferens]